MLLWINLPHSFLKFNKTGYFKVKDHSLNFKQFSYLPYQTGSKLGFKPHTKQATEYTHLCTLHGMWFHCKWMVYRNLRVVSHYGPVGASLFRTLSETILSTQLQNERSVIKFEASYHKIHAQVFSMYHIS